MNPNTLPTVGRGLSRVALAVIAALTLLAMLFLFLGSMRETSDMSLDHPGLEIVFFEEDSVALNLLFLLLFVALGIGLVFVLRRFQWFRRLTPARLSWIVGAWVFVFASLWVLQSMSSPTNDSSIVTSAGVKIATGDLTPLDRDYFIRFPFQLGYVFWTELWARLFHLSTGNYLILEIINALCLALGEVALVRLTHRLFRRQEVTFATAVALALFVQPMIFCSFLYGTMPAFCFAVWSMLLFVCYLQTDQWRYIIGAGLTLAISVGLKLNNMILLVAMAILLLVHLLKGKCLRRLGAVVLLCVMVLTLKNVGLWRYELGTDKDFGDGIPMVSWLAMGLNDAAAAPGWYSHEYTVGNFNAVGKDPDKAAEKSMEVIKARLEFFKENPDKAQDFFSKKILSQWNEPTYQSIWNNQVRGHYTDPYGFAAYACGDGEDTVTAVMDTGVQFMFFGSLAAMVFLLVAQCRPQKDRRPDEVALWLIPLCVLGGFLYHMLFEGKSQYVITYMTYLVPIAVWGVFRLTQVGKMLVGKCIRKAK